MKQILMLFIIFFVLAFINACGSTASKGVVEKKTTEIKKVEPQIDYSKLLNDGIEFYKKRKFNQAKENLQKITTGKAAKEQIISAHKYMAFTSAIEKNNQDAKKHFLEAFSLDKNFDLDKSEIGNPVWTPSFEDAKKEFSLTLLNSQEYFNQGKQLYSDRKYSESIKYLEMALSRKDLSNENRVQTYKYLAFIYSIQKQTDKAKQSFKKAFEINKQFELDKSEYGNPVWTPIYDQIKNEQKK
jgi:Tfp pilus assembly protein PilF